jgi:hypothetical protein
MVCESAAAPTTEWWSHHAPPLLAVVASKGAWASVGSRFTSGLACVFAASVMRVVKAAAAMTEAEEASDNLIVDV